MRRNPIHIDAHPNDISKLVIAVGDPSRAETLAGKLHDAKIINRKRGFLMYTGFYNEVKVTVTSHGIGGPSSLIVFEELISLGAKAIIRLGSTGAVREDLNPGSIILASSATAIPGSCGLSLYYDRIPPPLSSDPLLLASIYKALEERGIRPHIGPVFCSDSFYSESPALVEELAGLGVLSIDMETAALYGLSSIRGFKAASILIVSNNIASGDVWLSSDKVNSIALELFPVIVEAYSRYQ